MLNAESIGIALSAATLLVIAATAVAAIIQLRHLRASNQLTALLEILAQWNQPAFQAAYSHFVRELPSKLSDPEYVRRVSAEGSLDRASFPEFLVFDLWEQIGAYAKSGLIEERILLDIVSAQVQDAWHRGWPVIEIMRRRAGPATCENFEYLAVRAKMFQRRWANGTYPRRMPRMANLE